MAPISFGSNIASLNGQRMLGEATKLFGSSLERLSTGLRINRASDDDAGLAIASNLNLDRRVYSQGVRNLNDGISLLNTAESSVSQMSDILTRLRELATSAANGTFSVSQRQSLDKEAYSLQQEFNRMTGSTKFNGLSLLSGSLGSLLFQGGYGTTQSLTTTPGSALAHYFGIGSYGSISAVSSVSATQPVIVSGDFNGDGYADILTDLGNTAFGNSSGGLTAGTSMGTTFTEGATHLPRDTSAIVKQSRVRYRRCSSLISTGTAHSI